MIPIRPGASLPALPDDQAEHAARVASLAEEALGSRNPSMIAEVCAILIANTISEHGIRDVDAVEPLMLTMVNDVMQRVNALGLAHLAIVKAIAAAKKSNN
jgi:hypothetical protein